MSRVRVRAWHGVAVLAAVAVVAACGSSGSSSKAKSTSTSTSTSMATTSQTYPPVDQPGVTAKEIKVGGIVTKSNDPTGSSLASAFDGVNAYFDYVNHSGGVYGRKLVLDSKRDDGLANNRSEVQALLSHDNVFAALPIAVQLFDGADLLAKSGIPTFGWDINEQWGSEKNNPGPPNFFGQSGSFICFSCATATPQTWLPKKLDRHRIGILAFNVPQSAACAQGQKNSFKKYPTGKIVFLDKSLAFGSPDYSAQVARMKDKKVDLVISCLDGNSTVNLAREIKKQELDAVQIFADLYNHELVKKNADVLDGSYLFNVFTPFEVKPQPPGTKRYFEWIKKSGGTRNENSLAGWINADLFVAGLKAAGPAFTRKKVVSAINAMTAYNAHGLVPSIDWRIAHHKDPDCFAVSKVVDGAFKPVYGKPGRPFVCFRDDLKTLPAKAAVSG